MFSVQILTDSVSLLDHRITTMLLRYPRIIHAEFMTHRVFSRNSASSRAIPFEKMKKQVLDNPFVPLFFLKKHKGMQGREIIQDDLSFREEWIAASLDAVYRAEKLNSMGASKQIVNRLLEPFLWHEVIVTSTEWDNFFELRCPKYVVNGRSYKTKKDAIQDHPHLSKLSEIEWFEINQSQAEIHIQKIAEMMKDALDASKPKTVNFGDYHIPFSDQIDPLRLIEAAKEYFGISQIDEFLIQESIRMIAVARCARLSYKVFGEDGSIDHLSDLRLYSKLKENRHASPFEHVAKAEPSSQNFFNFKGLSSLRWSLKI